MKKFCLVLICFYIFHEKLVAQKQAEPLGASDVFLENGPVQLLSDAFQKTNTPINRCLFSALLYRGNASLGSIMIIRRKPKFSDKGGVIPRVTSIEYEVLCGRVRQKDYKTLNLKRNAVDLLIKNASDLTFNQEVGVQTQNLLKMEGLGDERQMVFFCVKYQSLHPLFGDMYGGRIVNPQDDTLSSTVLQFCESILENNLDEEQGDGKAEGVSP